MKKKIIIILGVLLLAIFLRFAYGMFIGFQTKKSMMASGAPSVVVGPVMEESVIKQFEAPGRITSKHQVNVMARINGYLTKSYFQEGDYVKKGQVLFEIEPEEWSLAAAKAKASVDSTRAQLVYSEKQLVRAAELVKKDYIAKSEYDNALSRRDALRAELALQQSNYRDALRNLGYTRVKAPVDGRVGLITTTVGNYVNMSSGPLTTIYSIDPIYVKFSLNSNLFTELVRADKTANVNRKVDLFFSNGEKYELQGTQNFHDNKIDETTGTITMRATFDNPKDELIHGDYVQVYIYSNEKVGVPVVPQTAVMENPEGKYVYVLDAKKLPQMVFIETAGQSGDKWIIKSGLKQGDTIILDGIQKVIPSSPVKIVDKAVLDAEKKAAEEEASAIKDSKNSKTAE